MIGSTTRRFASWIVAAGIGAAAHADDNAVVVLNQGPLGDEERPVEEIVVLGKFIPDERRTTSEISNVLDEEALRLLVDSSVGGALTRVTGLSLVGGKYVYVRGLGERYSSTLVNGSRLSSPVPFQKTVPLDIVPKSLVGNLLVQKTYSAQFPGDFSGGVVDIRTRAIPEKSFLTVGVGVGGNTETTDGDGLTYRGGRDDNFGYDDGTRHLPDNVKPMSSESFESFQFPESAALGASFYNRWDVYEKDIKPDFKGEAEGGYRFDFDNGMSLGILVAGRYANSYRNRDKDLSRYEFTGVGGGSTQTVDYRQATTRHTLDASVFTNIGFSLDDNNTLTFNHVLLRQTDDEVQQARGLSSEDDVSTGTAVESYILQWTENEIRSTSLSGEHFFNVGDLINDARVSWRYVDGSGLRDSPDTRTYTYAVNDDGFDEIVTPNRQAAGDLREVFQAPQRNYAKLNDDIEEYGFSAELPFRFGSADIAVRAGWSTYERQRESRDRLFRFDLTSSAPDYVALMTPRQLFGNDNWGAGYLDVRDFSAGAANASGIFPFAESGEETESYYIAVDAQVTDRVRIQAGLRREDATLFADAWGGNTAPGTANDVSQEFDDSLPSGSLTWEFVNDMQVRVAYSETVNRPSLLEITGTTLRNPEDSNLYRGNVFLQPAELENLDVRWEWYFGAADSLSVGAFRKKFDNPIEVGKVQAQNDIFTWFNAEEADLDGVEFEVRKDLLFDDWFGLGPLWNYFNVAANVSFIDSEVTLFGQDETAADVPLTGGRNIARLFENERSLTGQSDVLGNLIVSYVDFDRGIEASLAYNYTDERIVFVGAENAPDIVEEARGKLDLLFKYTFDRWDSEVELELRALNITDQEVEWTQGGLPYERYDPGFSYSLTLKATL